MTEPPNLTPPSDHGGRPSPDRPHDQPETHDGDSLHHVQRAATAVASIVTPETLDQALQSVARPGVRPIAGGTDLMIELDRGQRSDLVGLVDLTRLPGLDRIELRDGRLHLGPLVTHNRVVTSPLLRTEAPSLVQACFEVGSPQLRNRATVVGNVVTASPANDSLTPLRIHDAHLELASVNGRRRVPLADFHLGVRSTALADDEIVVGLDLEPLGHWRSLYVKLGLRRAQAISVVHLAAAVRIDPEDRAVNGARLALGSVAPTVDRIAAAETAVIGTELDGASVARAARAAADAVTPIDDLRATADYRSALVAEMVERALTALGDDGDGGPTPGLLPDRPVTLWGDTGGLAPTGSGHGVEHGRADQVAASLNGAAVSAPHNGLNLLDWLRSTGATGTKEGCAEGECGSCTVYLDGMAVLSCLVPATRAHGATVTTIEGLGADREAGALQAEFVQAGAVQCGYCIPGFLMAGAKLIEEFDADELGDADGAGRARMKAGLSGNLCRCTGYYKIEDAVAAALAADTPVEIDR